MKNCFPVVFMLFPFFLVSCQQSSPVYPTSDFNLIQPFTFSQIGTRGSGDGQFLDLRGLVVDAKNGYIYTTDPDPSLNRIQKFDLKGNYLLKWNNNFNFPLYLAVDNGGNVYVTDSGNNRFAKYDPSGNLMKQSAPPGTGIGSGNGQFHSPQGIAIDGNGNVYVADAGNNRIQKFDVNFNYLTQWGQHGCGNSQFQTADGVAIDSNGNVYVSDGAADRIQKFDTNGNYILQWGNCGLPGSGKGQFNIPYCLGVDGIGSVYVSDILNNRIQKFDSSGNYVYQWGGLSPGSNLGQFNYPYGISFDGNNNVYVAEENNSRVQITYNPYNYSGLNVLGIFPDSAHSGQSANIAFQLTKNFNFSIVIKNSTDGSIVTQYQGQGVLGDNILQWNMKVGGVPVSGGVYLVQFQSGSVQKTAKLTYIP